MTWIYSIGNTSIRSLTIDDGDNKCVIVSVNPDKEHDVRKKCEQVIEFKYTERFPFRVNYIDPLRAGVDRIAFASFAFYEGIYPSYLIDAGTFITMDYFDGKRLYPLLTSPGMGILKDTLKKGYNLKGLSPQKLKGEFPRRPEEALYNGIYKVFSCGVECFIKKEGEILLTGGDAETLKELIGRGVIVNNAVLYGAYYAFVNGLI